MSTINTGTGGINVDGKSYTFDVSTDDKHVDPVPYDKGDIKTSDVPADVSSETKKTLAHFMNLRTSANRYAVDPDVVDASLETEKGVPTPTENKNSQSFVDKSSLKSPVDNPPEVTVARLRDKIEDPTVSLGIAKGKVYPQMPNGNDALQSVSKDDPGLLTSYTSVVLSNNRFSNASRRFTTDVSEPAHDYNVEHMHPRLGSMTDGRLAQVGVALTLRASQEMGSANGGNNPTGGAQEAKALLPGMNQLGASRVNTRVLEAKDVLSTLTREEIPSVDLVSNAPGGSWGSLNNVFDPYSGLDALGMIALASALTAATVVVFDGLGSLLSMIKGGSDTGPAHDDNGRYLLGHYNVQADTKRNDSLFSIQFPPDIGAALGIRPTVHPFNRALQTGVAAFFRVKTSGDILSQLTSTVDSATDSPGFNVVVARSIIRSSLHVIDSFKSALKSNNIVSGVKNVIGVIDAIKSSKFMSALNVFASLGDAILVDDLKKETIGTSDGGRPEEPTKKSRIDKLSDDAGSVAKNRLRDNEGKISLKLAWSNNRAPAMYLLPASTAVFQALAGGRMGAPQGGIGMQDPASKTFYSVLNMGTIQANGARIPYDSTSPDDVTVSSLERYLEGDYMPFYFHDLRTNEIVSFHAFLTSLSDEYSPNWEQTDAYGRADPVRVYKNTSRKIQLGFHVVSTSDEDFNDMWTKINKLVTLVYPQYTQGRIASDDQGNVKFVQPFSQLVGASPLIRLRLGDLIKSNYSRFGLARLFGADSNVMKLGGPNDIKFEVNATAIDDMQRKLVDAVKNPIGKDFVVAESNLSQPAQNGLSISLPMPKLPIVGNSNGDAPSNAPVFNVSPNDMPFFRFTVASKTSGGAYVAVVKMIDAAQVSELYGYSSKAAKEKLHYLSSEYDNSSKPVKRVVGGAYVVPAKYLRNPPEAVRIAFNTAFSSDIANVDSIVSFLSPDSNSLVKSFNSTAGKGLAGTIDSLGFNWYEGVLWETQPGKKAPQMCQVSISFTPIHDISPGLDWMGANRAPVYPVAFDAQTQDITK